MTYEIIINESKYNVIITKKKIKRLIIRVNYKFEILVSVPYTISNSEALNKVFQNTSWIENTIEKHKKIHTEFYLEDFMNRNIIYLEGNKYKLIKDNNIISNFVKTTDIIFYKKSLNKAIDKIYTSHYYLIEEEFNNVLKIFKDSIKQTPTLSIRKMKSRWGSCNYNTGKIVINKMLVSVPKELLIYVIYHEFTHLLFPNHGKDFYNSLGEKLNNHKNLEKKLKKHAFLLAN